MTERWMKLPKNEDYPGYKGLHLENDWCAKAGCVPACKSEIAGRGRDTGEEIGPTVHDTAGHRRVMKTEKEIKAKLKTTQKGLRETNKRFLKYDNVDDMHALPVYEAEIAILEWVLATGSVESECKDGIGGY